MPDSLTSFLYIHGNIQSQSQLALNGVEPFLAVLAPTGIKNPSLDAVPVSAINYFLPDYRISHAPQPARPLSIVLWETPIPVDIPSYNTAPIGPLLNLNFMDIFGGIWSYPAGYTLAADGVSVQYPDGSIHATPGITAVIPDGSTLLISGDVELPDGSIMQPPDPGGKGGKG